MATPGEITARMMQPADLGESPSIRLGASPVDGLACVAAADFMNEREAPGPSCSHDSGQAERIQIVTCRGTSVSQETRPSVEPFTGFALPSSKHVASVLEAAPFTKGRLQQHLPQAPKRTNAAS